MAGQSQAKKEVGGGFWTQWKVGPGFWTLASRDDKFQLMLLIASTLWVFTSITKFPFIQPSNYSDVTFLWFRDVYQGHHNMGIPYVDYELNFPPLIAGIIWLGQAISTYAPVIIDQYNTYTILESVLQYPFLIGSIYNIYILCEKLGIDKRRIYILMLSTLTFIVYGFYNWDLMVVYFVTLSIWLYLEGRYDGSSLALAASILTKLIPACMAPAMVMGLPNHKARLRFIAIAGAVWVAVNAPFALANFGGWLRLFTFNADFQLQNTWISMVISAAGLGDIVSGRGAGHALSQLLIAYLILRALVRRTSTLDKILLSWYAWFGAIYLFDPQMFIELFPIVILTPRFKLSLYRIADMFNAFIIIFYFIGGSHPELPWYIKDQLTPFGLVNTSAALRQLIVLAGYFVCFNPKLQKRLRQIPASLVGPVQG